jgi:hypothetical protein
LEKNFPSVFEPGLIEAMIDSKSQRNTDETSYVLIFDGKKVREGGDVDVLGFENGPTISERESLIETERKIISDIIHLLTIVSRSCSTVSKTNPNYRSKILDKLESYHMVISSNIKNIRLISLKHRISRREESNLLDSDMDIK